MKESNALPLNQVLVDVREEDEFDAEHVPGSVLIPLSRFAQVAPGFLAHLQANEKEIVILCRSGNRARLAKGQLEQMGYQDKVRFSIYEGGIVAWKSAGKPTLEKVKNHLPLVRQVHVAAGTTVAVASVLSFVTHPAFAFLALFFGLGLTLSGATGFCGMANILALMPWNKRAPSTHEELRQISASA